MIKLSNEKSPETTLNINAIPKCIDEPAKGLLSPSASEIGLLLRDLISLKTGNIHFQAEKMRTVYEYELKLFKESLNQKLLAKPTEYLVAPKLQIVGSAAEKARFCIDEPQLSEMFQNLLVNAADIRFQRDAHPSFSGMIEQMSPLDAQNLSLFKDNNPLPIAKYHLMLESDQYEVFYPNTFLANAAIVDYDLQASSISSLARFGLIEINYSTVIASDAVYEPFEQFPQYIEMRSKIGEFFDSDSSGAKDKILDVLIIKGVVMLTPLGSSFIRVCYGY